MRIKTNNNLRPFTLNNSNWNMSGTTTGFSVWSNTFTVGVSNILLMGTEEKINELLNLSSSLNQKTFFAKAFPETYTLSVDVAWNHKTGQVALTNRKQSPIQNYYVSNMPGNPTLFWTTKLIDLYPMNLGNIPTGINNPNHLFDRSSNSNAVFHKNAFFTSVGCSANSTALGESAISSIRRLVLRPVHVGRFYLSLDRVRKVNCIFVKETLATSSGGIQLRMWDETTKTEITVATVPSPITSEGRFFTFPEVEGRLFRMEALNEGTTGYITHFAVGNTDIDLADGELVKLEAALLVQNYSAGDNLYGNADGNKTRSLSEKMPMRKLSVGGPESGANIELTRADFIPSTEINNPEFASIVRSSFIYGIGD